MNYYLEITLLPNTDINLFRLWSSVYQQLHLALVEMQDSAKRVPIGLSFPDYRMGEKFGVLGSKCRIFVENEATLEKLDVAKWLARLSDYVHCTSIRPVPDKLKGYAIYRRRQPVTNKERLARRYAKRRSLSYEEALMHYQDMTHKAISLPFIRLQSLSSGRQFCLWLEKIETEQSTSGDFSTYGLSRHATVPEF